MSPHLHIPLSRFHKTTRRPRWVVWLLSAFFVGCVLLFWQICVVWFTGLAGLRAAPEGTQAAVQLLINKRTWPVLTEVLSSTPLISNRNLTLSDLSAFVQGEIIWFFGDDGSRSVAIRSNSSQLPISLLDAHHIVVQQISSHLFLLSEKLQPISGMKARRSFTALMPSFSTRFGAYAERDSKTITTIWHTDRMISFVLPGAHPTKQAFDRASIPESAYLVLSTPVYTNTSDETLLSQLLLNFSHELLSEEARSIFGNLLTNPGVIMIQDPINPSFLLVSEQSVDEKERIRLVQTILSLKYPQKHGKLLPDQTVSQELISDPSLISVEQRIISGQEFHHATTGSASLFVSKGGQMILTNNEEMLKTWLNKDSETSSSQFCNANAAYLSINKLLESNLYPTDRNAQDISRVLLESFTDIALESSGKSVVLNMCY